MSKLVVAIRHIDFEDLGSFAAPLEEAGYRIHYLERGQSVALAHEADLLVVLGGPMGVYETALYPWIPAEQGLIRARLAAGQATLGVCFGAQQMAAALGAPVYPGRAGKEIGFYPLRLTAAGKASPVARVAGEHCQMFHWHGDTFDLPEGATLLAGSERYPHQAFAVGRHGLALQCHPELEPDRIEEWLQGHAAELAAAGVALQGLREGAAQHGDALRRQGRQLLRDWLAGLS
ncbi:glutamine amidotransferase [Chitinimonas sp.]|uniref:glutamine amidotransferase n=1 Tax=Chitinimonas sp. TaxID=1934313 RepID=UPI002F958ED1